MNFLFSTWTVTPSLQSQLPDYSATLDRLNELKLSRKSLKYLEVIFKVTFSLALPSWLLKLPFQFTTAPRKRNESSRKAMHLKLASCVWASRQFRFGRIDVTNTQPGFLALSKMAAPDDEFFASLERNFTGIGCTMEAQTTVSNSTQCGLFIGEYKKCTLSGVTFSFIHIHIHIHISKKALKYKECIAFSFQI